MAGENVKNNLAARVDAVKLIPDNAVAGAKVAMDRLTELKPIQALAEGVSYLGRGIIGFVDEQAKITRRWTTEIRS
jgi:hypothetical protein